MFKRKKSKSAGQAAFAPVEVPTIPDVLMTAAEKEQKRGRLIGNLVAELTMWQAFAATCKPGRYVQEVSRYHSIGLTDGQPLPLASVMDEISAGQWKAFADSMATSSERRLREILS